ncbi:MAG: hypothetical protein K2Y37_01235 [Pirellulales bacterium]|nr:hypothetical protein [Pirellulales bacterium]
MGAATTNWRSKMSSRHHAGETDFDSDARRAANSALAGSQTMSKGFIWTLREAFASRKPQKVGERQSARVAEMVAYARANSPYYRDRYRDLPERVEDPALLPVTSKRELMAHFDDWATDREVTIEKARAFASNPDLIGEQFLGKYTVATTSGTTGTPGVFVLDARNMAVTAAMAIRTLRAWLGLGDILKILAGGGRTAMTIAAGSHSATAVAAARLHKSPSRSKRVLVLPVHAPLEEMVAKLNEFRPALLAPYASIAKLLAAEQGAGRLHVSPVLVVCAAEGLAVGEYDRIAKVFGAKVENSYAATECFFFSYGCKERWLHVNNDWAVLEPVDADYRLVPPGEQSHTVLLSNLANRVQPILRYDLGDSVLQRADPCPCGNPLPAIRVQGRASDVLTFKKGGGERVSIPPLALEVDQVRGVELFQIVQTTPTSLRVRLRPTAGTDPDHVWQTVHGAIARLLAEHKLEHVAVERAEEAPEQSTGGKYRAVIPLEGPSLGDK